MPSLEVDLLNRRRFLLTSAAALGPLAALAARTETRPAPWDGPAAVKRVYLGMRPSWPRPDVDLKQDIAAIETQLQELERRYPGQIRFTGGEQIKDAAEMSAWLAGAGDADVVLAFNMVTIVFPMLRRLVESGKPAVMFSVPYQGHDWSHAAVYAQKGAKLELIASSDFTALDEYVPLFRTIHHLRHSKVLLVSPPKNHPRGEGYTEQFGTSFAYPTYQELKSAFEAVDPHQAARLADEFIRAAAKVVEPTRGEIIDSMKLYLGIHDVLQRERANAIAIDCLGGFGRKELPAYPCVAFSKLNDAGLYGVCECDLESTMTQLLITSFSRRPGFVSDPVFDASRNEVIHAHCVAATRMQGLETPPCPYLVRSHLEDHKGVSMQVLTPPGEPVTVAKFTSPRELLLSTGEALGNVDNERGCRTKIRTKVQDARKLLSQWASNLDPTAGTRDLLHRVVFYGDYSTQVEKLAQLTGFRIVREG
jgi:hypothetical protein